MKDSNKNQSMQAQWLTSQLEGENSSYLEALYEQFLEDPESIEPSWRAYFSTLKNGAVEPNHSHLRDAFIEYAKQPQAIANSGASLDGQKLASIEALVRAYRQLGHYHASTDPLALTQRPQVDELELRFHGLADTDLTQSFQLRDFDADKAQTLQATIEHLKMIYCGNIGFEYMHIANTQERRWLREVIEAPRQALALVDQQWLLNQLVEADGLEKYLGSRFVGQKRFSLEGGDGLIPMINKMVNHASEQGVTDIGIGMAHRGRLNVLVNVLGKAPETLFAEFEGKHTQHLLSGDVKYHNGFSSDVKTTQGSMHIALAFNPSHLEIVSPVVEGTVRAHQDRALAAKQRHQNLKGARQMAIQVHGDSAFAGQGVVMETFSRSQVAGYSTGGSIHIVLNNQIGFTTQLKEQTRSSFYATDIAKMVDAPIFHVNGDDPEALWFIAQLAVQYRMQFHKDVVIDLVCYRRLGHNEADEPSATSPLMYQVIHALPVAAKRYAAQLVADGRVNDTLYAELAQAYKAALEKGQPIVPLTHNVEALKQKVSWETYLKADWQDSAGKPLTIAALMKLGEILSKLPEGFTPQRQVGKMLNDRAEMMHGKLPLNWGCAEMLAYASLLDAGHFIRLAGQDAQRGTFAHRHAVLHDQKTGETYTPLQQLAKQSNDFQVFNTILSEEAILAFEYGYSCTAPDGLVIWEAQFGDFANGAQVVIDQFMSSAEEKWGRLSGLTLFLPHGQEGMGAEHSSARLERYLQLCAHDNMQICTPTTPAQIYHLIRRQVLRPYRKPLVVMTPKSLLRHPLATSDLTQLTAHGYELVIDEVDKIDVKKVKRLILCQGKVYYDLLQQRRDHELNHVAIIRIEQLYPFPQKRLVEILKRYSHVKDMIWCQEEPENQGAWRWIQYPLSHLLSSQQVLTYAGREAFASPAVGYPALHHEHQAKLVDDALKIVKE